MLSSCASLSPVTGDANKAVFYGHKKNAHGGTFWWFFRPANPSSHFMGTKMDVFSPKNFRPPDKNSKEGENQAHFRPTHRGSEMVTVSSQGVFMTTLQHTAQHCT